MRIALFGFPMTGKSTVFSLLTGVEPAARTVRGEVSIGVAKVPDPRLDRLSSIYRPKKHTPATVEYLDLAGIEKGEAAAALPIDKLRNADALAHVVRGFRDEGVHHFEETVDPVRDCETMETELLLADHTVAERRVEKLEQLTKKPNREEELRELELLRKCLDALERGVPLRNLELTADERKRVRGFAFLTMKPLLVIVNADEADVELIDAGPDAFGLSELAGRPEIEVVAMSAKIEAELAHLEPEFAEALRADLRIKEPALDRVIRASYRLLGRISLFTVGEDECRAWTVRRGVNARAAAGAVHTDIERGFIRAAVVAYDDLAAAGSWSACRDNGTVRVEGKDYVVQDGDVVDFRFNI